MIFQPEKHVEIDGKEIVIANVNGKFYAIDDLCDHMNALLSMGNLTGNIVTCPFHGSKFDVTSGKKISELVLTPSQEMEPVPKTWQKYLEHAGQLMSHIKTYDQPTYEIKVEGLLSSSKFSSLNQTLDKESYNDIFDAFRLALNSTTFERD